MFAKEFARVGVPLSQGSMNQITQLLYPFLTCRFSALFFTLADNGRQVAKHHPMVCEPLLIKPHFEKHYQ